MSPPIPFARRILSVFLPLLPSDRILRQRHGRFWRSRLPADAQPLVVSHRQENAQRIAALDARASALGLRTGTGIADARAMHPGIEVVEADVDADRNMIEALADWCDRYTPLVALDGPNGLLLDITGCAHLFGGETALADDLASRLTAQGFDVRVGLASTPGAAWAAARYGLDAIAPGLERDALRLLPLAALRLDPVVCSSLESVGLRQVGMVMDAPRAPLVRRFGRLPILHLDQALGRVEEAISPRLPVPALSVERQLAEPIDRIEDIERLVKLLAERLEQDLERRQEGARSLQLALFGVDGRVSRVGLDLSRPRRDPGLILDLFRKRLGVLEGTLDPGCGYELLRLSVLDSSSLTPLQTDLVHEDAEEDSLAVLADRVRARLGDRALVRPVPVASHMPERAVTLAPFFTSAQPKRDETDPERWPERPIRLFARPHPIEMVKPYDAVAEPHMVFRWRHVLYRGIKAEGPERIAPEWWRSESGTPERDYFRVEDEAGHRYWLFREQPLKPIEATDGKADREKAPTQNETRAWETKGPKALSAVAFDARPDGAPRWFMHGVFA